jgi:uncharacterized protein (TIGR02246 family)
MTRTIISTLIVLGFSAVAVAQDKAAPPAGAAAGPDWSKVGPLSRKVTKEDKKGVADLYKAAQEAMKKGDVNAFADLVDFPAIMLSDDSKGQVQSFNATREQLVEMMKPMFAGMPKDVTMKSKQTAHFLSDGLAVAIEENEMSGGKMKGKWKGMSVLTLKDGRWKFKQMAEAGWGDMKPPASSTAKK